MPGRCIADFRLADGISGGRALALREGAVNGVGAANDIGRRSARAAAADGVHQLHGPLGWSAEARRRRLARAQEIFKGVAGADESPVQWQLVDGRAVREVAALRRALKSLSLLLPPNGSEVLLADIAVAARQRARPVPGADELVADGALERLAQLLYCRVHAGSALVAGCEELITA